jgi:hypothetical protein
MGFYDLLKALPGLQTVMQRLMSSVWLPPAVVLEWLEQHTQIRWAPAAACRLLHLQARYSCFCAANRQPR